MRIQSNETKWNGNREAKMNYENGTGPRIAAGGDNGAKAHLDDTGKTLGLKKCQQVIIELLLVSVSNAVGCTRVDFQGYVFDQLR